LANSQATAAQPRHSSTAAPKAVAIVDLDLEELIALVPPRGYGRD
jgi:hypothetical protein